MDASTIAKRHLELAIREATEAGSDADATARYMLGWVVAEFLANRPVEDVRAELLFVAENCDPNTDFMFMRP